MTVEVDGAIGITVPCVANEDMSSLVEGFLSHDQPSKEKLHKLLLKEKSLTLTLTTKQAKEISE